MAHPATVIGVQTDTVQIPRLVDSSAVLPCPPWCVDCWTDPDMPVMRYHHGPRMSIGVGNFHVGETAELSIVLGQYDNGGEVVEVPRVELWLDNSYGYQLAPAVAEAVGRELVAQADVLGFSPGDRRGSVGRASTEALTVVLTALENSQDSQGRLNEESAAAAALCPVAWCQHCLPDLNAEPRPGDLVRLHMTEADRISSGGRDVATVEIEQGEEFTDDGIRFDDPMLRVDVLSDGVMSPEAALEFAELLTSRARFAIAQRAAGATS